jgi:hypothetical protein
MILPEEIDNKIYHIQMVAIEGMRVINVDRLK